MRNRIRTPILIQQKTAHLRRLRIIPRRRPKLQEMKHRQRRREKRGTPENGPLEGKDKREGGGEGEQSAEEEGAGGDAGEGDGLGGVVLLLVCVQGRGGGGEGGEGGGVAEAAVGDLGEWVGAGGGGGGGEDGDCGFALGSAIGDGGGPVDGAVDSSCHFEGVRGVVCG